VVRMINPMHCGMKQKRATRAMVTSAGYEC